MRHSPPLSRSSDLLLYFSSDSSRLLPLQILTLLPEAPLSFGTLTLFFPFWIWSHLSCAVAALSARSRSLRSAQRGTPSLKPEEFQRLRIRRRSASDLTTKG